MKLRTLAAALSFLLTIACGPGGQAPPASQYETARAEHRSLVLAVEASGVIEPVRTVEIKSKASGEILELGADTGDTVQRGALLARIDPRTPRNRYDQAIAQAKAAQAKLVNARGQLERGEKLLTNAWINQAEYDQLELNVATAESEVVTAKVTVENARISLDDTEVRAPADGTILSKRVERGQVISSPTMDVGGGTLLMTMAELDQVRVRARVDETDIGKLAPGMPASISVASYPGRRFAGTIEKIEPQAIVEQNVTLFPVLISLPNEERLLRPGMNVEASFDVARRENALTVPVTALRTERDIDTTAAIIGVDPESIRASVTGPGAAPGAGGGPSARGTPANSSGYFWLVVDRDGVFTPVPIATGLTDLDRVEVTQGLVAGDMVLVLPSSSLIETQERLQSFMSSRGGIPGITQRPQEQPATPSSGRTPQGR
jgi:HlyD family secretion protein